MTAQLPRSSTFRPVAYMLHTIHPFGKSHTLTASMSIRSKTSKLIRVAVRRLHPAEGVVGKAELDAHPWELVAAQDDKVTLVCDRLRLLFWLFAFFLFFSAAPRFSLGRS